MSIGKTVKNALRWMVLGKGVTQAVNWLVTIVVIRILTPADYGLLAMAMVLIAAAQMLRDMGLQQALVQATEITELAIRQVYTALIIIGGLIYTLLYLLAPLVAASFGEDGLVEIIRILGLQFILLAFHGVPSARLARKMDFRTKALLGTAGGLVNSIVTLALALLDFGIWSLIFGNLASNVVVLILYTTVDRVIYRPTFKFVGFWGLFTFGGWVMLSSFLHYIQMKSADLIVGKLLGRDALGIYSVSNRLATLPMQKISSILTSVGFAAFTRIQNDGEQVKTSYLHMQSILSFFAFPVFWGIASVTDSLVTVVLGEKWLSAIIPLQLIAIAAPLRMIFSTTTPALNGTGRPKIVFQNLALSAATMPIAFGVAVQWGINGVAAVWVLYYPLLFAVIHHRALAALNVDVSEYIRAVYKPVIISASMLVALLIVDSVLGDLGMVAIQRLMILVVLGVVYYGGLSYLTNRDGLVKSWKLVV